MKADYHVHTEFSDDSEYQMEQVVRDSIVMGLDEICFTDHVDYGVKNDWDDGEKIRYREGIPGEPVHTIEQYEKLYAKYPFDFIILSVHEVEDKEFWTQDFQRDRTQQEYNERYYEELLYLVQNYHNYSVLGHMDLITRYDKAGTYPFEKLKPIFTEILKTGIEVNTSSHRYGLSDLTPSRDILKLYRELGGTIITIGSDSHKPEHLGTFIDETKQELKTLGFKEFCTFDKMKPIYHQL